VTLRIAWLGPWNPQAAVARFGRLVVAELQARGHRVTVLRTETGNARSLPPLPAEPEPAWLDETPAGALRREHDVVLANVGNNFAYHGALLPRLAALDAVLILHDFFLGHLALEWARAVPGTEPTLRAMVSAAYGGNAWPAREPFWTDQSAMARRRPMLECFAAAGIGAVVHAQHYEERTRAACAGPVACLPLAFDGPSARPARPMDETLTLLTVGHLNPNRQADQVVRAIARSPRLRHCRLRIVGPFQELDRRALLSLAMRLEVAPPIFAGWVDDAELARELDAADVLCCLRAPVLEGASASVILAMLSARPTLVSDHGCYAEIPDDCVYKCTPGEEAADIARHLEAMIDDPAAARATGLRAAAYAERVHHPARYVDGLLPLLEAAIAAAPGLRAGLGLGRVLAELGALPSDPAAARIAAIVDGILGAP
jgi:glycosyltransferase involved in cell wall biosynthesis